MENTDPYRPPRADFATLEDARQGRMQPDDQSDRFGRLFAAGSLLLISPAQPPNSSYGKQQAR